VRRVLRKEGRKLGRVNRIVRLTRGSSIKPYTKESTKRRSGTKMGEAEEQQAGKPRSARVNEDKGGSSNYEGLPELGRHVFTTGIGQADNRKTTDATATAEHAERTNRNEMYTHILTDDEAIFAAPAVLAGADWSPYGRDPDRVPD
jgi:hypothetical protein